MPKSNNTVTPARAKAAIAQANTFIARQPGSTAVPVVRNLRDIVADLLKELTTKGD